MSAIVLKEEVRNNKPWCLLVAEVIDSKLTVTRVDFEEWERNSRSGQVEISHIYDEENTRRFMESLDETDSDKFLRKLKATFSKGSGITIMHNISEYCKKHKIDFRYHVWY